MAELLRPTLSVLHEEPTFCLIDLVMDKDALWIGHEKPSLLRSQFPRSIRLQLPRACNTHRVPGRIIEEPGQRIFLSGYFFQSLEVGGEASASRDTSHCAGMGPSCFPENIGALSKGNVIVKCGLAKFEYCG